MDTTKSWVRVERDGRVAWVIIERPAKFNALSNAINRQLSQVIRELDDDIEIGCVVLRGGGDKAFSAGADLTEVTGKTPSEYRAEFGTIVDTMRALRESRLPIIAAVRGYALGGGFGLVAAADMVIAADDAVFATPEITIGRFPLIISAGSLRGAHRNRVFEMAFSGERFDANYAYDMGLVNHVVSGDELWERVAELAGRIASYSPEVVALGKRALHTAGDVSLDAALEYLREALVVNAMMDDSAEGVTAFLEKRPPIWSHERG
jgi:enoyl-CoA hydratase